MSQEIPATKQKEEKPEEDTFLAVHEPYLSFTLWKGNCILASAFTDQNPEVSAACMRIRTGTGPGRIKYLKFCTLQAPHNYLELCATQVY